MVYLWSQRYWESKGAPLHRHTPPFLFGTDDYLQRILDLLWVKKQLLPFSYGFENIQKYLLHRGTG